MIIWTDERRARQAERIREQKPWLKSTGPKTAKGKSRSKQNAYKHGLDTETGDLLRMLLRTQKAFLKSLDNNDQEN